MLSLNKEKVAEKFRMNSEAYASVCNSCACGGTYSCSQTCKGCTDKNGNVQNVKQIYSKK